MTLMSTQENRKMTKYSKFSVFALVCFLSTDICSGFNLLEVSENKEILDLPSRILKSQLGLSAVRGSEVNFRAKRHTWTSSYGSGETSYHDYYNEYYNGLECPFPYIEVGSSCLYFNSNSGVMTWNAARTFCQVQYNGDLAVFSDTDQYVDAITFLKNYDPYYRCSYWIGGLLANEVFQWITGSPIPLGSPLWGAVGDVLGPTSNSSNNFVVMAKTDFFRLHNVGNDAANSLKTIALCQINPTMMHKEWKRENSRNGSSERIVATTISSTTVAENPYIITQIYNHYNNSVMNVNVNNSMTPSTPIDIAIYQPPLHYKIYKHDSKEIKNYPSKKIPYEIPYNQQPSYQTNSHLHHHHKPSQYPTKPLPQIPTSPEYLYQPLPIYKKPENTYNPATTYEKPHSTYNPVPTYERPKSTYNPASNYEKPHSTYNPVPIYERPERTNNPAITYEKPHSTYNIVPIHERPHSTYDPAQIKSRPQSTFNPAPITNRPQNALNSASYKEIPQSTYKSYPIKNRPQNAYNPATKIDRTQIISEFPSITPLKNYAQSSQNKVPQSKPSSNSGLPNSNHFYDRILNSLNTLMNIIENGERIPHSRDDVKSLVIPAIKGENDGHISQPKDVAKYPVSPISNIEKDGHIPHQKDTVRSPINTVIKGMIDGLTPHHGDNEKSKVNPVIEVEKVGYIPHPRDAVKSPVSPSIKLEKGRHVPRPRDAIRRPSSPVMKVDLKNKK